MIDIHEIRRKGWEIEVDEDGDISYKSPRMSYFRNTWSHESDLTNEYLMKHERKEVKRNLYNRTAELYMIHLEEMLDVAVQPLQL